MKRFLVLLFAFLYPAATQAGPVARSGFFIPSVLSVDTVAHTATFPLHKGTVDGKTVWFIITDASDVRVAKQFRVDYAPDLKDISAEATQRASKDFSFDGAPDFSPPRTYVAGASGFPPKSAAPGSIADGKYSPFVKVENVAGVINAPIIATGDGPFDVATHTNTEDRVVAIDTVKKTATLVLARGFFNDKPVYYLSTEASDPVAASVERATYVPKLAKAGAGTSIPIGVVLNGPQDGRNPQGLAYLALRTPLDKDATESNVQTIASPFNVLSLVPNLAHAYAENGYSPLWNVMVVGSPQRARLTNYGEIAAQTKSAGFFVNCPAVAFGDDSASGTH